VARSKSDVSTERVRARAAAADDDGDDIGDKRGRLQGAETKHATAR
jgi:hypothetical protein